MTFLQYLLPHPSNGPEKTELNFLPEIIFWQDFDT